jgi:hypothetical protein
MQIIQQHDNCMFGDRLVKRGNDLYKAMVHIEGVGAPVGAYNWHEPFGRNVVY